MFHMIIVKIFTLIVEFIYIVVCINLIKTIDNISLKNNLKILLRNHNSCKIINTEFIRKQF
jgi:hypothetical protein